MVLERNPTRKHLLIEWWREEEVAFRLMLDHCIRDISNELSDL